METSIAVVIGVIVTLVVLLILFIIFAFALTLWSNDFPNKDKYVDNDVQLHGKTALVTGASKGIGATTAKELARRGARVILAVRNIQKTEPIRDEIIRDTNNDQVKIMQVDLSDLESVHRFCVEYNESEPDLHILINNAGLAASSEKTKQGFGMVMQVNYIAPFLMTHLLLEKIKKSSPSRIITLTSHTVFMVDAIPCINRRNLDLTEIDDEGNKFPKLNGQRDSRLYGIMMMKELSKRLSGTGVTCYSAAPGGVDTQQSGKLAQPMMKLLCRDVWAGSQTVLYCALEEGIENESGSLFDNCHTHVLPKTARYDDVVKDLYEATLKILKINDKI